jgi:hypothetical protein
VQGSFTAGRQKINRHASKRFAEAGNVLLFVFRVDVSIGEQQQLANFGFCVSG